MATIANALVSTISSNYGSGGAGGDTPDNIVNIVDIKSDPPAIDTAEEYVLVFKPSTTPERVNDMFEDQIHRVIIQVTTPTGDDRLDTIADEVKRVINTNPISGVNEQYVSNIENISDRFRQVHAKELEVTMASVMVSSIISFGSSETDSLTVNNLTVNTSLDGQPTASLGATSIAGDLDIADNINLSLASKIWIGPNDYWGNEGGTLSAYIDGDKILRIGKTTMYAYQDFRPYPDATQNLGDSMHYWNKLYLKNLTFDNSVIVSDIKDEDDMVSDSDTALATQQSIKAYVDSGVADATLTGLTDVNISGMADDDVLTYDTGTSKWINEKISHTDLNDIGSSDHHTKTTAGDIDLANLNEKNHSSLTNINSDDHHTAYTDSDARSAVVSDEAYAGTWDADTTHASSKNALYDKFEAISNEIDSDISSHASDVDAHHAKTTSISDLTDHDKTNHDSLGLSHDSLSDVSTSDHHTKYALTDDLASGEITQLQNIDSKTISNTQWGYVGSLDQSLSTSDSPSFSGLSSTDDLTVGSTSTAANTKMGVYADDDHEALIEAYGNSQGTGRLYIGQNGSYGGGMVYQGDGTPVFGGSADADTISFYRTDAGSDVEVFWYNYNGNRVYFEDDIQIKGNDIRDNGGSVAISFDGSGNVDKIGQSTATTDYGLIWDGSKAVWKDIGTVVEGDNLGNHTASQNLDMNSYSIVDDTDSTVTVGGDLTVGGNNILNDGTIFDIITGDGTDSNSQLKFDFPDISTAIGRVRLFRTTNSSGTCALQICDASGTDTTAHNFDTNGDAIHAGDLTVSGGNGSLGNTSGTVNLKGDNTILLEASGSTQSVGIGTGADGDLNFYVDAFGTPVLTIDDSDNKADFVGEVSGTILRATDPEIYISQYGSYDSIRFYGGPDAQLMKSSGDGTTYLNANCYYNDSSYQGRNTSYDALQTILNTASSIWQWKIYDGGSSSGFSLTEVMRLTPNSQLKVGSGLSGDGDNEIMVYSEDGHVSAVQMKEGDERYGFDWAYDGSPNEFYGRRYNGSTSPNTWMTVQRSTGAVTFEDGVYVHDDLTLPGSSSSKLIFGSSVIPIRIATSDDVIMLDETSTNDNVSSCEDSSVSVYHLYYEHITHSSSEVHKSNIQTIDYKTLASELDKSDLQVKSYTRDSTGQDNFGFVAEEVPDRIQVKKEDGTVSGYNLDNLVTMLYAKIRTQDETIQELEQRISKLEGSAS